MVYRTKALIFVTWLGAVMPGVADESVPDATTALDTVEIPAAIPLGENATAIKIAADATGGEVSRFYEARSYRPAWENIAVLEGLKLALWKVDEEGISRPRIGIRAYRDAIDASPGSAPEAVAARDVAATTIALRYITWLRDGMTNPQTIHPKWDRILPEERPHQFLAAALDGPPGEFRHAIRAAARSDAETTRLREALVHYRALEKAGGWQRLSIPEEAVEEGDAFPEVYELRKRLQIEGDLPDDVVPEATRKDPISGRSIFDGETATGVRNFQRRHGIVPDGILGPNTLGEMNRPVSAKVRAIEINLERLRWMPIVLPARCVVVNIPRSELVTYSGGKPATRMRVIVGEGGTTPTPVFHDFIEYLVFRPYWNVPIGIARDEIVPAQRRNYDVFDAYNYEIVSGYGVSPSRGMGPSGGNLSAVENGSLFIRQRPGENNALGLIKFIFPNDSAVYLHDTSSRELFKATDRDMSHGCVRVEKPAKLGAWALEDEGVWSEARVQQMMNDESVFSKNVNLKNSLPVYLIYQTVSTDRSGTVYFDQDIYGHDQKTALAMGL